MALVDDSTGGIYTISLYDSQDFSSRRELRPKSLISDSGGGGGTSEYYLNKLSTSDSQEIQQQGTTSNEDEAEQTKQQINKIKMKRIFYFVLDIFIFVAVLTFIVAIEREWIPSKRGGFFCNDPKISYKYHGDTITTKLLLLVTILLPIVFLYTCEVCAYIPIYLSISTQNTNSSNNNKNNYLARSQSLKRNNNAILNILNKCGVQTLHLYREYMIGLVLLTVVVELGKMIFGEPRPHFLDTCQPDAAINCTNSNQYINEYKCTAVLQSSYSVHDSYKSFPSGHAAFSAYTGLFVAWYLNNRFINVYNKYNSWMLKPLMQLVCFTWMFITPLSRVTDFRHHWWDALAGTVLGVIFTYYTVTVLSNQFIDVDNYYYCGRTTNINASNIITFNSNNGGARHHHPSIKRLLSTTSSIHHPVDDKELTDINTYQ